VESPISAADISAALINTISSRPAPETTPTVNSSESPGRKKPSRSPGFRKYHHRERRVPYPARQQCGQQLDEPLRVRERPQEVEYIPDHPLASGFRGVSTAP
jgi:hypothetical protein